MDKKIRSDELNLVISPITHDKDGRAQVFVRFSDGDRYAEGRLPGPVILSSEGFSDEELEALKEYMRAEKAMILSAAKKNNVMKAFLGQID